MAAAEPAACTPTTCAPVKGSLRAAGDRRPLAGATIVLIPAPPDAEPGRMKDPPPPPDDPAWLVATRTDDDGVFETEPVRHGLARVVVVAEGMLREDVIVEVGPAATKPLRLFARPDPDEPYRTEVAGPALPSAQREPTRRVLEREEIQTLPGSQGDPLRAIQNLPGAVRAPGGLGVLILRGASPAQSRVFIGGLAVPRAFHVLSLSSVIPADLIERLDFIPGNFDARYGGATGGIVELEPRTGRRDGVHGFAELDLAAASAMVEGPLLKKKGSFVVAAQRGYFDAVIAGASKVAERTTGDPNDLLLPGYYDYQALFSYPVGPGELGVRVFGAGDRLRAQRREIAGFEQDFGGSNSFDFRSGFHRLDVPFEVARRRSTTRLVPSVRLQTARRIVSGQALMRRRTDVVPAARLETEQRLSPHATLLVGTDFEVARYFAVDEQRPLDVVTAADAERREDDGVESQTGVYATTELHWGPVTLRPGARATAFTVDDQARFSVDPRALGHVDVGESWRLSAGLGRYSQMRPISDRDSIDLFEQGAALSGSSLTLPSVFGTFDPEIRFAPDDTDLSLVQALQASAGAEARFAADWTASATGFFREQQNGEPLRFQSDPIAATSSTRTGGAELLLRRRLGPKLYGWVAYTLMFSELRFTSVDRDAVPDNRPSDFDQRHNFVAVASYRLRKGWRIGGRFRVTTGFPYRPVIGSVSVRGGYLPVLGGRNTARLGTFHQLDLRVDKTWVVPRASVSAYLDIQNVYNRVNPEALLYSTDFRSEVGVIGLPIFPTLGVRVDY